MKINGTIRKDSLPKDTVSEVKNILHNLGIETVVVDEHKDKLFSSVRIEIDGIAGIGTNGKGINSDYSLASAYGEFMERLQSGCLLYNSMGNMRMDISGKSKRQFSLEEMCDLTMDLFADIFDVNLDEFKQFLNSNQQFLNKAPYFDVMENKIADLPDNFIFNFCGSNGLCAGNTPLEAICQGIGEVLERMILKKIYTDPGLFPNISDSVLTDLPTLEIKKFLESKNYQCIIKDCSLFGAFPVVGLLILDPS